MRIDTVIDTIARRAAWLLPRKVVYWAVIRAGVHATTGPWGAVETPATTLTDVLDRWRRC